MRYLKPALSVLAVLAGAVGALALVTAPTPLQLTIREAAQSCLREGVGLVGYGLLALGAGVGLESRPASWAAGAVLVAGVGRVVQVAGWLL